MPPISSPYQAVTSPSLQCVLSPTGSCLFAGSAAGPEGDGCSWSGESDTGRDEDTGEHEADRAHAHDFMLSGG